MAKDVTKADFETEVLKSSEVVLVDFWAPWCGPCQSMLPIIEELSKELGTDAKIVKVNVDESPELASEYDVMSIPALKIFKGGEVVEEMTGVQSKDDLKALIEKHR